MNALMATGGTPLTMTSREIAELTGKRHDNVMRTIETLYERRVIGLPQFEEVPNDGPGPMLVKQYQLLKRDTYVLVAQLSPEFTAALVDRWQELEARQAPVLPQTMAQALRLAAEQAEALEKQQAQLEAAKPKVEFVDTYVQASSGSKGFRQVCKLLNANENEFRTFLKERDIMYRLGNEWTPRAQHITAGRFETKAGVAEHGDTSHAYNQAKFTPKGVQWVAAEWAKHPVALAVQNNKAVAV